MPEVYARHHSKIVDAAFSRIENQNDPNNYGGIINRERLLYARHKSGFIFPVYI